MVSGISPSWDVNHNVGSLCFCGLWGPWLRVVQEEALRAEPAPGSLPRGRRGPQTGRFHHKQGAPK